MNMLTDRRCVTEGPSDLMYPDVAVVLRVLCWRTELQCQVFSHNCVNLNDSVMTSVLET
jgi:hypothetical protein